MGRGSVRPLAIRSRVRRARGGAGGWGSGVEQLPVDRFEAGEYDVVAEQRVDPLACGAAAGDERVPVAGEAADGVGEGFGNRVGEKLPAALADHVRRESLPARDDRQPHLHRFVDCVRVAFAAPARGEDEDVGLREGAEERGVVEATEQTESSCREPLGARAELRDEAFLTRSRQRESHGLAALFQPYAGLHQLDEALLGAERSGIDEAQRLAGRRSHQRSRSETRPVGGANEVWEPDGGAAEAAGDPLGVRAALHREGAGAAKHSREEMPLDGARRVVEALGEAAGPDVEQEADPSAARDPVLEPLAIGAGLVLRRHVQHPGPRPAEGGAEATDVFDEPRGKTRLAGDRHRKPFDADAPREIGGGDPLVHACIATGRPGLVRKRAAKDDARGLPGHRRRR